MKTLFRPDEGRIHKRDAWKTSAYAFVPTETHFGELCGFADDVVEPGQGFGLHPHRDMEISTVVLRQGTTPRHEQFSYRPRTSTTASSSRSRPTAATASSRATERIAS